MGEGNPVGALILAGCCWLAAAVFAGFGIFAKKKKLPMWFWSEDAPIDPRSICDIPAYNRENGKMWMRYGIWFFGSGLCGIMGIWDRLFFFAALGLLVLSVTLGFWLMLRTYKRICKKYTVAENN